MLQLTYPARLHQFCPTQSYVGCVFLICLIWGFFLIYRRVNRSGRHADSLAAAGLARPGVLRIGNSHPMFAVASSAARKKKGGAWRGRDRKYQCACAWAGALGVRSFGHSVSRSFIRSFARSFILDPNPPRLPFHRSSPIFLPPPQSHSCFLVLSVGGGTYARLHKIISTLLFACSKRRES